jgi:nitrogen-specific signal transduction histidine kinase
VHAPGISGTGTGGTVTGTMIVSSCGLLDQNPIPFVTVFSLFLPCPKGPG